MSETAAEKRKRIAAEKAERAELEALAPLADLSDEDRQALAELSAEDVATLAALRDAQVAAEDAEPVPSYAEQLDAARFAVGAAEGLYAAGKASLGDIADAKEALAALLQR